MEPLRKLGYVWLALIFLVLLVMFIYFLRISRCQSIDFVCRGVKLYDNKATIVLRNQLYDVEITNLTASCNLAYWNINEKYKRHNFELNQEIQLNVYCKNYFEDMELFLIYVDSATNLTHSDSISIKR